MTTQGAPFLRGFGSLPRLPPCRDLLIRTILSGKGGKAPSGGIRFPSSRRWIEENGPTSNIQRCCPSHFHRFLIVFVPSRDDLPGKGNEEETEEYQFHTSFHLQGHTIGLQRVVFRRSVWQFHSRHQFSILNFKSLL